MISSYADRTPHRLRVGALMRDRGDMTSFGQVMVVGHLTRDRVLIVRIRVAPWAPLSERGVRSVLISALQEVASESA